MTRAEQIDAAVALRKGLKNPPPEEKCRENLEHVLDTIEAIGLYYQPQAHIKVRRAFLSQIKQVEKLIKTAPITGIAQFDLDIETMVKKLKLYAETFSGENKMHETTPVQPEWWVNNSSATIEHTRGTYKQAAVALNARELLLRWGATDKELVTTPDGTWYKMAAILYGNEKANLFQYLRAVRPRR
jgi:hypothetical protein